MGADVTHPVSGDHQKSLTISNKIHCDIVLTYWSPSSLLVALIHVQWNTEHK